MNKSLLELERILRDVPMKTRHEDLPPLLNPNNGRCVMCNILLPLKNMPVYNSGIVMVQEPLCKECAKTLKDQSKIACVTCREVVLWVDPHKEKTGFIFQPRKIYHIKSCPTCSDVTQSRVLEKVVYYEKNKIPYD